MASWERVVSTTIQDHIRGFEQAVLRKRKLLARLKKAGNIEYNVSGDGFTWRVQKDQRDLVVNNGAQQVTFDPKNLWAKASLDYGGYVIKDAITKREKLENKGTAAIVKVWGDVLTSMFDDLEDRFAEELYIDSSATGNTGRLSGIQTFLAATQTITQTTTTSTAARTANAADLVAYPNDTYAGLSTVLGNDGGSCPANWPMGKCDPLFDYWSPVIVNYTSSGFDGSSTTWAANCDAAVRFLLMKAKRNSASKGVMDLVLLDNELYRKYADKQEAKEHVYVNTGSREREYGIDADSFYKDGAEITWEFGIPVDPVNSEPQGFGYNISQLKLRSLQETLFAADPIQYDMESRSWRAAVDFLGEMRFYSPKYFGALRKLA